MRAILRLRKLKWQSELNDGDNRYPINFLWVTRSLECDRERGKIEKLSLFASYVP